MKITLICIGKLKEKYWKDALAEYSKRLSAYCDLKITELREEPLRKDRASEILEVKQKEGERIMGEFKKENLKILLDVGGEPISSEEFADLIEKNMLYGRRNIDFIIGGSDGVSKEVKQNSDMAISFSHMTFPHQMMRVILLEQIYRAYKIINHETYHK